MKPLTDGSARTARISTDAPGLTTAALHKPAAAPHPATTGLVRCTGDAGVGEAGAARSCRSTDDAQTPIATRAPPADHRIQLSHMRTGLTRYWRMTRRLVSAGNVQCSCHSSIERSPNTLCVVP